MLIASREKPLGYRRVSELLVELANFGIAHSNTSSRGRHGYGTEYKLSISPDIAGKACSEKWWNDLVRRKTNLKTQQRRSDIWKPLLPKAEASRLSNLFDGTRKNAWKNLLGLEE